MDISVIIPTYNQEERLLSMVLDALENLDTEGIEFECLIVDNNSPTPVSELGSVQQFLERCPWARVVVETEQGATYARIAGIQQSTGRVVVFVDDDNVLSPEYLRVCLEQFASVDHVGVWGAGNISASLLDPVEEWLTGPVRAYHCVREAEHPSYGCVPESWESFYPIGMGMALTRELAESYTQEVLSGKLAASCRKGNSLASAGDCQIVWHAISKGFSAGVHPGLSIDHLVPARRSTVDYLKRVAFGTSSSYCPAFYQSYPHIDEKKRGKPPSSRKIMLRLFMTTLRQVKRRRLRLLPVEVAVILGEVIGRCRAINSERPAWVFSLAKRMKLID